MTTRARLKGTWRGMKYRCSERWKGYGYYKKGIRVCEEWENSFEAFYEWAISNGYADDLSIDRIDNSGNYEPSNCRWATMEEQAANKTVMRRPLDPRYYCEYEVDGEVMTLRDLCRKYKKRARLVLGRMDDGHDIATALKMPLGARLPIEEAKRLYGGTESVWLLDEYGREYILTDDDSEIVVG